jgi:hypothetical protein
LYLSDHAWHNVHAAWLAEVVQLVVLLLASLTAGVEQKSKLDPFFQA